MNKNTRIKLNDGLTMPVVALGVWQSHEGTKNAVLTALKNGYRHIDTAAVYHNEKAVGEAIKESGIPRNEIFVTTKLWNDDVRSGNTREALKKSLENLGLDYVDLYLIHWPAEGYVEAYLEMENNDYKKVWGGPKEFLSLIRGAALICTDSFHGTMFSINFQRNFFSFCKSSDSEESSENSRLYSALNIFGLSNRIIHNMDNLTAEDISIDYKNVIPILEEQRRDSIEYLENMLFEMTKG